MKRNKPTISIVALTSFDTKSDSPWSDEPISKRTNPKWTERLAAISAARKELTTAQLYDMVTLISAMTGSLKSRLESEITEAFERVMVEFRDEHGFMPFDVEIQISKAPEFRNNYCTFVELSMKKL